MTGFKIDVFSGEKPKIPPRHLSGDSAQTATNCNLKRGQLSPLKSGLFVWTPTKVGTILSIHRFATNFWFHWTTDVDAVRGPIAEDTTERTYYTGDGVPKVTDSTIATSGGGTDYPNNSYDLGVPQPSTQPTLSLGAGGGCDAGDQISITVAYTYVTGWGEEGPPSTASAVADVCDGQTVTVSSMEAGPSGAYNVTHKRIYVSIGGDFQYLTEIPVATTSYEITTFDATVLNEPIISTLWYAPPTDMHSIAIMPTGFAVGLSKNELCFSEPYQLHAWPSTYREAMKSDGVALGVVGQSVVIVTEGLTHLWIGVDPAATGMQKLEANQSCVSKRSMVDMGGFVVYASPDGLVAISSEGEVNVATEEMMTREQWQELVPESIHGYNWEGTYVGFYDTGVVQKGFIFDPTSDVGFVFLDFYATAGFNDTTEDALYLVVDGDIVQFDASTALTYSWLSKKVVTTRPLNYGAAQVIADSYPVNFDIYAGGVLKKTKAVADDKPFRLPTGYLSTDWEVGLRGTPTVEAVYVAEDMEDLQQL